MAKTADPKFDVDTLKQRIREAGLRSTAGRIAVFKLLHEIDAPITHAEASSRLSVTGLDHATVYRNLTDLTDAGLATRTDLGDHVWRFELLRGEANHKTKHPHFLCTDCGTVECLPEGAVTLKAPPSAPKAMRKRSVAVQVSGLCDDCGDSTGEKGA